MPIALASTALVSLEEARSFLGADPTDDPVDDQLALIINGLSTRIAQKTGDLYVNPVAEDGVAERSYQFNGSERTVTIDNARSISEVAISGTPQDVDSWTVLDVAEYYLEPVGQPVSTKVRFLAALEVPTVGSGWGGLSLHTVNPGPEGDTMWTRWPSDDAAIEDFVASLRVKAKFGLGADAATVPANVKLAVAMWLQNIDKRDLAYVSETIGAASALTKMPPDVEELLAGETDSQPTIGAV